MNNEQYNLNEQKKKFKNININELKTTDDYYEFCKFMYHKAKRDNKKFRTVLMLSIPLSVIQIAYGCIATNNFSKICLMTCGMIILFHCGRLMETCETWNRDNEKFIKDIEELRRKEKINMLHPK